MTGYDLVKDCNSAEEMVDLCDNYRKEAGLILYNKRMFSGLRLIDVAEILGYKTPGIVNKWERGKNQCSPENLHKLSVILNLEDNEVDYYKLLWSYISKIKYILNNPGVLDKVLEHIEYDKSHRLEIDTGDGGENEIDDIDNNNIPNSVIGISSDVSLVNGDFDDMI